MTLYWVFAISCLLLAAVLGGWLYWRLRTLRAESVPRSGGAARLGAQAPEAGASRESAAVPESLGRYALLRPIGRGAMGVVYLGRDLHDGGAVAIKTMALADEFDPDQLDEARQRFFREAETAARLHHSGIVAVLGSGEDAGLAWIAMEYLRGEPLSGWTDKASLLPLAEALSVVRQTALALEHAHRHGVVHRDVKPANILYDRAAGKIKVTDFGVARLTDSCRTRTGLVLGTPAYMSPEQLAGRHIDARSDLFSLGVMLYQLVTGQLPFRGDSLGELMHAIVHKTPDDPRLLNPRLPAALAAIVTKALQKEASARFQNGAQMALAVVRLETVLREKKMPAGAGQDA